MAAASRSESARILDPLGLVFRRLSRRAGHADDAPALTGTQRLVLIELHDASPRRLNELADLVGTSAATASRAVDGLVQLGLAVRLPDPRDRRAVSIELSDAGRTLVDERRAQAAAILEPAAASLTSHERRELVRLLKRLAQALVSPPGASARTPSPARRQGSATRRTRVG